MIQPCPERRFSIPVAAKILYSSRCNTFRWLFNSLLAENVIASLCAELYPEALPWGYHRFRAAFNIPRCSPAAASAICVLAMFASVATPRITAVPAMYALIRGKNQPHALSSGCPPLSVHAGHIPYGLQQVYDAGSSAARACGTFSCDGCPCCGCLAFWNSQQNRDLSASRRGVLN